MNLPRLIRTLLMKAGLKASPVEVSFGLDVVGDIAILKLKDISGRRMKKLGEALFAELPSVKSVFEQQGGIEGEFRLRRLRLITGEKRTLTLHRENGCAFRVDVRRCYFSPRLSTERLRIAKTVGSKERVLNMFAGVGPFSIVAAKKSGASVTSCELNSYACRLHEENVVLNKVGGAVEVLNCEAHELKERVATRFDRTLMPHPSAADRFLPDAIALTRKGGVIHYYRHVLGRNEEEAAGNLEAELKYLLPRSAKYKIRKVVEVGPRWLEMVADIRL
jgi:tRNA (guanine37-N1)-methyltransferase